MDREQGTPAPVCHLSQIHQGSISMHFLAFRQFGDSLDQARLLLQAGCVHFPRRLGRPLFIDSWVLVYRL